MANVTLSIDDEVLSKARKSADALGTSVNQLIRDFLTNFTEPQTRTALREEFVRLSLESTTPLTPWKFNRDEIHERR